MNQHQAFPDRVIGTGGVDTQAGALLCIGPRAPLPLWQDIVGYCLDAPNMLPAGSVHNRTCGDAVPTISNR